MKHSSKFKLNYYNVHFFIDKMFFDKKIIIKYVFLVGLMEHICWKGLEIRG